jgi:hypothetical protein
MATDDRRRFLSGAVSLLLAPAKVSWAADGPVVTASEEEAVYARALPAYVYGFAFRHAAMLRWTWFNRPPAEPRPSLAYNHMWRQSHWPDTALPFAGRASLATLACAAWLNLGDEPIILSVPDSGRDYFAVRLCSADCDVFAYVGSRTGTAARHYAIAGPGWTGPLPASLTALLRAPTREAVLIAQVFVDGPGGLARARRLQTRIDVTPLSLWAKLDATYPPVRETWKPATVDDPMGEWRAILRALRETPSGAESVAVTSWLESLGLAAAPDDDRMALPARRGLSRAASDGMAAIAAQRASARSAQNVGWLYPPRTIGKAGLAGDYLTRAATQCTDETLADTIEEVIVLVTAADASGAALDGRRSYRLRFSPGHFPLAAAWSLTVCDQNGKADLGGQGHLAGSIDASTQINRHGLDLAIGSAHEGAVKRLGAPSGPFELVLRFYGPGPDLVAQRWQPPRVEADG